MISKITMPQLSPTMTKGLVAHWLVKVGDEVKVGDIIVEVETDKVTIEIESTIDGVVEQLLAQAGDEVAVDAEIASFAPLGTKINIAKEPENESSNSVIDIPVTVASDSAMAKQEVVIPTLPMVEISDDIKISPVAKRMALQNNVDVSKIKGTGPQGKIVKADIDKALNIDWSQTTSTPVVGQSTTVDINYDSLPVFTKKPTSSMRKVVAGRLSESSKEIPHFYMSVDCNIDKLLNIRRSLNERLTDDARISVNDLIMKATAKAFKQVPEAHVMWAGDSILSFEDVDISIAVAIKDGLITPVLRKADKLSISEISAKAKQLVGKARDGKLAPAEYQGGTFTISNLGMFGIKDFTSIINPPQCGILSVGVGEKRAVVIDDEIEIATVMTLTLAMDHRCVDGATGAKYLQALKKFIEDPMSLLL